MKLQHAVNASYDFEVVMPEYEYNGMVEEIAELRTELATQKSHTKSAIEYAELMDDADTATNVELDRYKNLFHDAQLEIVGLEQDKAQALTDLARTKRECTAELDMFKSNLDDFRDDDRHMRRRIKELEDALKSKDGECDFLYSHLVDLISQIASTPKHTCGVDTIYTPQISTQHIDELYHELNVWSAALEHRPEES